jgi:hypothetical protein
MSDQESKPGVSSLAERFSIDTVINGLAEDLQQLRDGKIGVDSALARAALAKQLFNGVRLVIQGQRMLAENAKPIMPPQGEIDQ